MADKHLLNFLLKNLEKPNGRQKWMAYRKRSSIIDLANADLTDKDLTYYNLSQANLTTAVMLGAILSDVDLTGAELSYADMRRTTLRNCCFERANLNSANLQGAVLSDARMERVNLSGARLCGADLIGADLSGADLRDADLRGASLRYARLTGAKLDRANVAEADLTGSIMDNNAPVVMLNFNMAFVDDRSYREIMSRLTGPKPPSDYSKELAKEKKAEDTTNGAEEDSKGDSKPKRTIFDSLKGNRAKAKSSMDATEAELEIRDYVATMADLETRKGWFRILGIDVDTPLVGITKAFRKKAKQFHPDMVRDEDEDRQEFCRLQFELIHEAYEKLSKFKSKPLTNLKMPPDVPVRRTPYEYTLEEYLKLAAANPNHVDLLYNMGWKYFEIGDMDKAIETYERVLGIDRNDEDAEYNLRIIKLLKSFDLPPELALEAPA